MDGMIEICSNKHAKEACVASDKDPFETLPEDVLQYLLSFLPSRDVVQTCVLARRWHSLWKAVPSLLINTDDEKEETYKSAQALNKFVHNLLLSRERVPLHICKINSFDSDDTDEALENIEYWLRYAVSCQVQVLGVYVRGDEELLLPLSNVPLISAHLTRLEFKSVEFSGCSLDFSTCPALKVLKAIDCAMEVERISSQSLTHLIINGGRFLVINARTRISVPSLIVLELANFEGYTPLLECMPSLVRAFLRFAFYGYCYDRCDNGNYFGNCGSCERCCYGRNGDNNDCILLEALSGVTNLELLSPPELHSPILERITLQLGFEIVKKRLGFDEEPMDDETVESYIPKEQFVISKHLKVVKIKFDKEDERIHQTVEILSTLGVLPEQIYIERTACSMDLERFSFEQRDENSSSGQEKSHG